VRTRQEVAHAAAQAGHRPLLLLVVQDLQLVLGERLARLGHHLDHLGDDAPAAHQHLLAVVVHRADRQVVLQAAHRALGLQLHLLGRPRGFLSGFP